MATQESPSLGQELREYNRSLDARLRGRFGMTIRTFKLIKAVTQLVGAAAGIYAMQLGAPPLAALVLVFLMVTGPEGMEFLINSQSE